MTIREEGGDYHLPNRILILRIAVAADGRLTVMYAINQCFTKAAGEGSHTVFFRPEHMKINGTLGGDKSQPFRNAGINAEPLSIIMDPECTIKCRRTASGVIRLYRQAENASLSPARIIGEMNARYTNVPLRSTHEWRIFVLKAAAMC